MQKYEQQRKKLKSIKLKSKLNLSRQSDLLQSYHTLSQSILQDSFPNLQQICNLQHALAKDHFHLLKEALNAKKYQFLREVVVSCKDEKGVQMTICKYMGSLRRSKVQELQSLIGLIELKKPSYTKDELEQIVYEKCVLQQLYRHQDFLKQHPLMAKVYNQLQLARSLSRLCSNDRPQCSLAEFGLLLSSGSFMVREVLERGQIKVSKEIIGMSEQKWYRSILLKHSDFECSKLIIAQIRRPQRLFYSHLNFNLDSQQILSLVQFMRSRRMKPFQGHPLLLYILFKGASLQQFKISFDLIEQLSQKYKWGLLIKLLNLNYRHEFIAEVASALKLHAPNKRLVNSSYLHNFTPLLQLFQASLLYPYLIYALHLFPTVQNNFRRQSLLLLQNMELNCYQCGLIEQLTHKIKDFSKVGLFQATSSSHRFKLLFGRYRIFFNSSKEKIPKFISRRLNDLDFSKLIQNQCFDLLLKIVEFFKVSNQDQKVKGLTKMLSATLISLFHNFKSQSFSNFVSIIIPLAKQTPNLLQKFKKVKWVIDDSKHTLNNLVYLLMHNVEVRVHKAKDEHIKRLFCGNVYQNVLKYQDKYIKIFNTIVFNNGGNYMLKISNQDLLKIAIAHDSIKIAEQIARIREIELLSGSFLSNVTFNSKNQHFFFNKLPNQKGDWIYRFLESASLSSLQNMNKSLIVQAAKRDSHKFSESLRKIMKKNPKLAKILIQSLDREAKIPVLNQVYRDEQRRVSLQLVQLMEQLVQEHKNRKFITTNLIQHKLYKGSLQEACKLAQANLKFVDRQLLKTFLMHSGIPLSSLMPLIPVIWLSLHRIVIWKDKPVLFDHRFLDDSLYDSAVQNMAALLDQKKTNIKNKIVEAGADCYLYNKSKARVLSFQKHLLDQIDQSFLDILFTHNSIFTVTPLLKKRLEHLIDKDFKINRNFSIQAVISMFKTKIEVTKYRSVRAYLSCWRVAIKAIKKYRNETQIILLQYIKHFNELFNDSDKKNKKKTVQLSYLLRFKPDLTNQLPKNVKVLLQPKRVEKREFVLKQQTCSQLQIGFPEGVFVRMLREAGIKQDSFMSQANYQKIFQFHQLQLAQYFQLKFQLFQKVIPNFNARILLNLNRKWIKYFHKTNQFPLLLSLLSALDRQPQNMQLALHYHLLTGRQLEERPIPDDITVPQKLKQEVTVYRQLVNQQVIPPVKILRNKVMVHEQLKIIYAGVFDVLFAPSKVLNLSERRLSQVMMWKYGRLKGPLSVDSLMQFASVVELELPARLQPIQKSKYKSLKKGDLAFQTQQFFNALFANNETKALPFKFKLLNAYSLLQQNWLQRLLSDELLTIAASFNHSVDQALHRSELVVANELRQKVLCVSYCKNQINQRAVQYVGLLAQPEALFKNLQYVLPVIPQLSPFILDLSRPIIHSALSLTFAHFSLPPANQYLLNLFVESVEVVKCRNLVSLALLCRQMAQSIKKALVEISYLRKQEIKIKQESQQQDIKQESTQFQIQYGTGHFKDLTRSSVPFTYLLYNNLIHFFFDLKAQLSYIDQLQRQTQSKKTVKIKMEFDDGTVELVASASLNQSLIEKQLQELLQNQIFMYRLNTVKCVVKNQGLLAFYRQNDLLMPVAQSYRTLLSPHIRILQGDYNKHYITVLQDYERKFLKFVSQQAVDQTPWTQVFFDRSNLKGNIITVLIVQKLRARLFKYMEQIVDISFDLQIFGLIKSLNAASLSEAVLGVQQVFKEWVWLVISEQVSKLSQAKGLRSKDLVVMFRGSGRSLDRVNYSIKQNFLFIIIIMKP